MPNQERPRDEQFIDHYAEARAHLSSFIGGEWVPFRDNFAAMKHRLRVAQAVSERISTDLSRKKQPTIPLGLTSALQLFEHDDLTNEEVSIDATFFLLSIMRAGITRNGRTTQSVTKANDIFNDYFKAAWRTLYPGRTDPGKDTAMYRTYVVATESLRKDMGPYIRNRRVISIFTLGKGRK